VLGTPTRATTTTSSAATPSGLSSVEELSIQNTLALSHCSLNAACLSTGVKKSCQVLLGGTSTAHSHAGHERDCDKLLLARVARARYLLNYTTPGRKCQVGPELVGYMVYTLR
jgi:hypothetical protein